MTWPIRTTDKLISNTSCTCVIKDVHFQSSAIPSRMDYFEAILYQINLSVMYLKESASPQDIKQTCQM